MAPNRWCMLEGKLGDAFFGWCLYKENSTSTSFALSHHMV